MSDALDKIKLLGLKSFLPMLMDFFDPAIKWAAESQKDFEFLEGEVEIVLIAFIKEETAYASICTMSADDKVMRQLHTAAIKDFIFNFMNKKKEVK